MAEYYPLFFKPVLKDYIWGGKKLVDYGRGSSEMDRIAESWEISAHDDGMTCVENGLYQGLTLKELLNVMGENLVGAKNQWVVERQKFPILVKLIDAKERLSVQVHPNDAYAAENEGDELGKTEMWVVLDAEPNAGIIYGLKESIGKDKLRNAIEAGKLGDYLNFLPVKKGDHICVPSRTLHAILQGAVIAEIQQNSNTTYRVYDWNRTDDAGNARPLHIEKALDVINFEQINLQLSDPTIVENRNNLKREILCQNQYFTTERYSIKAGETYMGLNNGESFEIWGILSGCVKINDLEMREIKFTLLPAALRKYEINVLTDATLLRTYVA